MSSWGKYKLPRTKFGVVDDRFLGDLSWRMCQEHCLCWSHSYWRYLPFETHHETQVRSQILIQFSNVCFVLICWDLVLIENWKNCINCISFYKHSTVKFEARLLQLNCLFRTTTISQRGSRNKNIHTKQVNVSLSVRLACSNSHFHIYVQTLAWILITTTLLTMLKFLWRRSLMRVQPRDFTNSDFKISIIKI